MRKMKRIITLVMAVVMMMAMSMTAFASEAAAKAATITVLGAGEGVSYRYVQLIKPDRTKETGWTVTDLNAFSDVTIKDVEKPTDQDYVKWYLNTAKESERSAVLDKVNFTNAVTFSNGNSTTVTEAGLYVVNVDYVDGFQGDKLYDFKRMGVDVNFTEDTTGLTDRTVQVKKEDLTPNKKFANNDSDYNVVEVTKEVPYSIDFEVPFFAKDTLEAKQYDILFGVSDTLVGGYIKDDLTVVHHDFDAQGNAKDVTLSLTQDELKWTLTNEKKTGFTLDLTQLINADNSNRNHKVTVTYTAVVTGTIVDNTARFIYNDEPKTEKHVKSYTGEIRVYKTGEKNDALKGAEFVIAKFDPEDVNFEEPLYAVLNDKYELVTWTDDRDEAVVRLATDATGYTPKAKGFDNEETYYVYETQAPEGYSLQTNEFEAVWDTKIVDFDKQLATANVADTKLINLPFTGGIGTTIFTVLGVAIMAMAAALFFATKKNANK